MSKSEKRGENFCVLIKQKFLAPLTKLKREASEKNNKFFGLENKSSFVNRRESKRVKVSEALKRFVENLCYFIYWLCSAIMATSITE